MQKLWKVPIDIDKRKAVCKTRLANRNTTLLANLRHLRDVSTEKKKN